MGGARRKHSWNAIWLPIAKNTVSRYTCSCGRLLLPRRRHTSYATSVDPARGRLRTEQWGFERETACSVPCSASYAPRRICAPNRCRGSLRQGRCKPAILLGGIRHGGCRARVKPPPFRRALAYTVPRFSSALCAASAHQMQRHWREQPNGLRRRSGAGPSRRGAAWRLGWANNHQRQIMPQLLPVGRGGTDGPPDGVPACRTSSTSHSIS